MITKLRNILGLSTLEENLTRYQGLNEEIEEINSQTDALAETYYTRTTNYNQILKSEDYSSDIKKSVQSRYDSFLSDQKKSVIGLVNRRHKIEKEVSKLLKNDNLSKAVQELNTIEKAKENYKSDKISKGVYDSIIKAKKGKVHYSDNFVFWNGKLLIIQRATDDEGPNMWVIPGGHVDAGEGHEEAAARELQEETGIVSENPEMAGQYENDDVMIKYYTTYIESETEPSILLDTSEHQSYKWIDVNKELDNYEFPFNMKENIEKIFIPEKQDEVKIFKAVNMFIGGQISKNVLSDIIKARSGVYTNTYENRKLGRVGQRYGTKKEGGLKDLIKRDRGYRTEDKPENVKELEERLGVNFYLHKPTGSLYGRYGDKEIRLSNHASKFTEKTSGIDLNYNVYTAKEMEEKIKETGRDFLKDKKKGEKIEHKRLGGMYFQDYNKDNKIVTVINKEGVEKKYHDDVFIEKANRHEIEKAVELFKKGIISKNILSEIIKSKKEDKIAKVMREFAEGKLKSSSGEKVTDRDQALAIAYSEAGLNKSGDKIEKAYLSGCINEDVFLKARGKEKIKGGMGDNKTIKDIAKKHKVSEEHIHSQLKMGIDVEMEHTNDKEKSKEIALDHLMESSDYYTKLAEMEDSFEKARTGRYSDNPTNRRLKRVGQEYGAKAGEDTKETKEGKKEPENEQKKEGEQSVEEHAKQSSETALQEAAKGGDEELRMAAKKELDRREKEENASDRPEEKVSGETEKKTGEEAPSSDKDYDSEIKDLESKIRELRNEDIDYSDEKALDENAKQIREAIDKRRELIEEQKTLRKVPFQEYMEGFKDFSQDKEKARKYYKESSNKINKDNIESVNFYIQGSGYEDQRTFNSGEDEFRKEFKGKFPDADEKTIDKRVKEQQEHSKNISDFISNNKIEDDIALNRRVSGDGVKFFSGLEKGDIYEDKSFSSTSLDELDHFGDFNINILAKKGSNVANIDNEGELEYLIDKGSKFRVLDKSDNGIIVELL